MLSLLIRVSYFPSASRTRSNRKEVNHSDSLFQSQLRAVPSAQHVTQYVAEQNPPFKSSANPAQYVAKHDTAISPTRCPACCPLCCRARRHPPSPAPIPAVRRPISPAVAARDPVAQSWSRELAEWPKALYTRDAWHKIAEESFEAGVRKRVFSECRRKVDSQV